MSFCIGKTLKSILIVMAMLATVGAAYAVFPRDYPPGVGPMKGDYHYQGTFTGSITSTIGWRVYNGTSWGFTTTPVADKQPFTNNIYLSNSVNIDADFKLSGKIIGNPENNVDEELTITDPSPLSWTVPARVFTVNPGASVSVHTITAEDKTIFVNKGTATVTDLTLQYGETNQRGGHLDNSGTVNVSRKLFSGRETVIISREGGTVMGTGTYETASGTYADILIKIANAGGYDAAIQLAANPNNVPIRYFFIGNTDQVSGNNMPLPVYSLSVEGGHKLTLSKPITVHGVYYSSNGDPNFRVASGSTLDLQGHTITSLAIDGAAKFVLEDGATVITAHPDGISSDNSGGLISNGAIRLNNSEYSSGANYVFSGTGVSGQRQFSGCFATSPTANTVRNITNNSSEMLKLCSQFQPLEVTDTWTGTFNHVPDLTSEGYIRLPTLPVTLSYFGAVFNGFDSVTLQWETQSETNNLGFYVLRSDVPDAVDAKLLSGLIPAANTSQGAVYCYEDKDLYDDGVYYYWLQDVSFAGEAKLHGPTMVLVTLQSGSNQTPDIPLKTSLVRNRPNPFNPSTQLEYYLEKGSDVDFKVYNFKGQLVDQFTLRHQDKGLHRYTWQPKLSSGTYLIKFSADGKSNTRKVILSK